MSERYNCDSYSTRSNVVNVTDLHVKEEAKKKPMTLSERVKRGEEFLANQGLFIIEPVNSIILLTPNERAIIDVIRHACKSEEFFLSTSAICCSTGIHSNKTVIENIKTLVDMGLIKKGKVSKKGTHYEMNYVKYNNAIYKLNQEKSPIERLRVADSFRGEGKEIHSKLINILNNNDKKIA